MQHLRGAHARARVRRTCSQVAKLIVKGVIHPRLQRVVDFTRDLHGPLDVGARQQHLEPDVVLFVDHDAHGVLAPQQHGGHVGAAQQVAADDVPLHHLLALELGQVCQAHE